MLRKKILIGVFFLVLAAAIWSTDSVTLQNERTIYTADCIKGEWRSNKCSGKMLAGSRYRYRAFKARSEVIFWIAGSDEPSRKLVKCKISDGRNWNCPVPNNDAGNSVTLGMKHGLAVNNREWPTRPLHPVSKVFWYMLIMGLRLSHTDNTAP
jgi:hypothetical protein